VSARTITRLSVSAETSPRARIVMPTSVSTSIERRIGASISPAGMPMPIDQPVSGERLIDAYDAVPSSSVERQLPSFLRSLC
jgi:hypothetical protein